MPVDSKYLHYLLKGQTEAGDYSDDYESLYSFCSSAMAAAAVAAVVIYQLMGMKNDTCNMHACIPQRLGRGRSEKKKKKKDRNCSHQATLSERMKGESKGGVKERNHTSFPPSSSSSSSSFYLTLFFAFLELILIPLLPAVKVNKYKKIIRIY